MPGPTVGSVNGAVARRNPDLGGPRQRHAETAPPSQGAGRANTTESLKQVATQLKRESSSMRVDVSRAILRVGVSEPAVTRVFLVGLAGALGTICRYAIGLWARSALGTELPYGTLIVNVVGCFLIALISELAISTTLAMLMNTPCSTTPGISLSTGESAGASGIWPKLQSKM